MIESRIFQWFPIHDVVQVMTFRSAYAFFFHISFLLFIWWDFVKNCILCMQNSGEWDSITVNWIILLWNANCQSMPFYFFLFILILFFSFFFFVGYSHMEIVMCIYSVTPVRQASVNWREKNTFFLHLENWIKWHASNLLLISSQYSINKPKKKNDNFRSFDHFKYKNYKSKNEIHKIIENEKLFFFK